MASLSRRIRRGSVALSPSEYRYFAIRDLFRLYAAHVPFRAALGSLAATHREALAELAAFHGHSFAGIESRPDPSDAVSGYIAAIHTLANMWGLDRVGVIPVVGELTGDYGVETIHRWGELAYADSEETGKSFGFGFPMPSPYPGIDTTVHVGAGNCWHPEEEPRSDSEQVIPERHRALYGWRWATYTTGARTRIMKSLSVDHAATVDSELDRIQGEHESSGHQFPDAEPRYPETLRWTFQRLALRRAVADIAQDAVTTEKYCRKRLGDMRVRLGIESFPKAERKRFIHTYIPH